jgi:hypothetical protein
MAQRAHKTPALPRLWNPKCHTGNVMRALYYALLSTVSSKLTPGDEQEGAAANTHV